MLHVDIGIMVYNEEKNIVNILDSISQQKLNNVIIDNIEVISSGSTDKTNELVTNYSKKNNKIHLITQKKREGKPSAINEFLKNSKNETVIIASGDVIFKDVTIDNLLKPFIKCDKVKMTSVNPIPLNGNCKTVMGFVIGMHWKFHNLLERHGEVIAFKKGITKELPTYIVADEAYIESLVRKNDMKALHVKDAVVYNKGPENPIEFLQQIRRHFIGHLKLRKMLGYSVSSMKIQGISIIIRYLTRYVIKKPLKIPFCIAYVILEISGRILGTFDYITKKEYHIWKIIPSTKDLNTLLPNRELDL